MAEDSMKGDHYLAEMLELMRSQGAKDNPVTPPARSNAEPY